MGVYGVRGESAQGSAHGNLDPSAPARHAAQVGDPSNIDVTWRSALMLSACVPAVLAGLFLLARETERAATVWLAALLFVAALGMQPQVLGFSGAYLVWPGLTFAPFNFETALGPLLYLHADRLMRGGPLGWRRWLLAPAAVQGTYYLGAFVALGDDEAKWAYNDAFHLPYVVPLETAVAVGLLFWSLWAVRRLVTRYRAFIAATQSATDVFEPIWFERFTRSVVLLAFVYGALELYGLIVAPISYTAAFPFLLLLMAAMSLLGMEALTRLHVSFPKMGSWVIEQSEEEGTETLALEPERDWAIDGATLAGRIIEEGWHLEPGLGISDLARRLGTNESYISRALNRGLGKTFSAFINGLRVESAKAQLEASDAPILAVAHDCGFNSKATFNRAFRDATAMTPSAWRQRARSAAD